MKVDGCEGRGLPEKRLILDQWFKPRGEKVMKSIYITGTKAGDDIITDDDQ